MLSGQRSSVQNYRYRRTPPPTPFGARNIERVHRLIYTHVLITVKKGRSSSGSCALYIGMCRLDHVHPSDRPTVIVLAICVRRVADAGWRGTSYPVYVHTDVAYLCGKISIFLPII